MERINRIQHHPLFLESIKKLSEMERNRTYCCHGVSHSLDVARICYIICLENGLNVPKDWVYGASLLHDLGRIYEYTGQQSHESGSIILAQKILPECGYSKEEIENITKVIAAHRNIEGKNSFEGIFQRADKLSRNCFSCEARETCKWSEEQMNKHIIY